LEFVEIDYHQLSRLLEYDPSFIAEIKKFTPYAMVLHLIEKKLKCGQKFDACRLVVEELGDDPFFYGIDRFQPNDLPLLNLELITQRKIISGRRLIQIQYQSQMSDIIRLCLNLYCRLYSRSNSYMRRHPTAVVALWTFRIAGMCDAAIRSTLRASDIHHELFRERICGLTREMVCRIFQVDLNSYKMEYLEKKIGISRLQLLQRIQSLYSELLTINFTQSGDSQDFSGFGKLKFPLNSHKCPVIRKQRIYSHYAKKNSTLEHPSIIDFVQNLTPFKFLLYLSDSNFFIANPIILQELIIPEMIEETIPFQIQIWRQPLPEQANKSKENCKK
jgi:hypothetical protein